METKKIKKVFPTSRINVSVPHLNKFGNKVVTIIGENGYEVEKINELPSFKKEVQMFILTGMLVIKEIEVKVETKKKPTPSFGSLSKATKKAEPVAKNEPKKETTATKKAETKKTDITAKSK